MTTYTQKELMTGFKIMVLGHVLPIVGQNLIKIIDAGKELRKRTSKPMYPQEWCEAILCILAEEEEINECEEV